MDERIKEFAKSLIKQVRDRAIVGCDSNLKESANSLVAKRWRAAANQQDPAAFLEMLIADSVDDAIFYVLNAIDNGMLQASFKGCDLGKEGRGELGGWYMSTWREEYSQQRSYDDFKSD